MSNKMTTAKQTIIQHLGNVTKVRQGKAVVEEQNAGGFMVMMPDGAVQFAMTKKDAERRLNVWFKRDLERLVKTTRTDGLIGIGIIEWRML